MKPITTFLFDEQTRSFAVDYPEGLSDDALTLLPTCVARLILDLVQDVAEGDSKASLAFIIEILAKLQIDPDKILEDPLDREYYNDLVSCPSCSSAGEEPPVTYH